MLVVASQREGFCPGLKGNRFLKLWSLFRPLFRRRPNPMCTPYVTFRGWVSALTAFQAQLGEPESSNVLKASKSAAGWQTTESK